MKVIFTQQAFQKFRAYIQGIEYEISGFGKVEKRGEDLLITDVKIFDQVVTASHTVMDAQALARFWDELIVAGEDIGKWKLWWHSHVYMKAMFSGTDIDTIEEFDTEGPEENWMLSIVANKLGQLYCQVDIFEPIRCTISNVGWDIELGEPVVVDVKEEIQQKVTIRQSKPLSKQERITWYGGKESFERQLEIFRLTGKWPTHLPLLKDGIPNEEEIMIDVASQQLK